MWRPSFAVLDDGETFDEMCGRSRGMSMSYPCRQNGDVWFTVWKRLLQHPVWEHSGGTELFTGEKVIFLLVVAEQHSLEEAFCKILCRGVEHISEKYDIYNENSLAVLF
jgi:hypothetical protein